MKTLDIIKLLTSQGYKIEYTRRPKGGYFVSSVNGKKFRKSAGNTYIRELAKQPLTAHQRRHYQNIRPKFGAGGKRGPRVEPLPAEVKNALSRAHQAVYYRRKQGEEINGKLTTPQIRRIIEKFGVEEAKRKIDAFTRRVNRIAYVKNVNLLIERIDVYINKMEVIKKQIEATGKKFTEKETLNILERLKDYIIKYRYNFSDDLLMQIYAMLYDFEIQMAAGQVTAQLQNAINNVLINKRAPNQTKYWKNKNL